MKALGETVAVILLLLFIAFAWNPTALGRAVSEFYQASQGSKIC